MSNLSIKQGPYLPHSADASTFDCAERGGGRSAEDPLLGKGCWMGCDFCGCVCWHCCFSELYFFHFRYTLAASATAANIIVDTINGISRSVDFHAHANQHNNTSANTTKPMTRNQSAPSNVRPASLLRRCGFIARHPCAQPHARRTSLSSFGPVAHA